MARYSAPPAALLLADPFAGLRDDGLSRFDLDRAAIMFDAEHATLIGDWHGREYDFVKRRPDSMPGDRLAPRNRKLSYGCAFEEHWEFTSGDTVASTSVIRGFDLASHQWKYSLVDKWIELATFTGEPSDSGWVFAYDIPGANPRRLHIKWIATPGGYTEVTQVSPDSGRTWPIVRHLNYTRDRARPR